MGIKRGFCKRLVSGGSSLAGGSRRYAFVHYWLYICMSDRDIRLGLSVIKSTPYDRK
jgi:hypothetical protein